MSSESPAGSEKENMTNEHIRDYVDVDRDSRKGGMATKRRQECHY